MLAGLLLVMMAIGQLGRPTTHRAIGRMLGEATPVATATPLADTPPLLGPETFAEVTDNAPFRDAEQAAWFRVINTVRAAEVEALSSQSIGLVGYAALSSQPDVYRGRVLSVAGTVHRVEAVTPATNDAGIDRLWRVTMQPLGGEVWPITVYTLEEPRGVADEPYEASAIGVFFKKLSYRWAEGVGVTPVVVARRLETTLDASANKTDATPLAGRQGDDATELEFERPAVGSLGRALLADLGVEMASLAAIEDRKPLTSRDTEAFYRVLGAVAQSPAPQLARLARAGLDRYVDRQKQQVGPTPRDQQIVRAAIKEQKRNRYSVAPLFGDGRQQRGELVMIDAVVRRAVRIEASQSEVAQGFGVDHYYELEAFAEDSQNLPLVFVVRDLPAGFPVGDSIRQPARLAGFFFKQWAYRNRHRTEAGGDQFSITPLLIGRAPITLAMPEAASMRPGPVIGVMVSLGLLTLAATLWRLGRRDRQYEAATLSRYRESPSGEPLDFDRLNRITTNEPETIVREPPT